MIILDTNVVSEVMRAEPDSGVLGWLDAQLDTECFITVITAAELRLGVARLDDGRRKAQLADAVDVVIEIEFVNQVLPFDHIAAEHYADIASLREALGRPISGADAQIASICRAHDGELATRNTKDFSELGLELRNPWELADR